MNGLIKSVDPTVFIPFEGNVVCYPKKSAKISPSELFMSLNDTSKEFFYDYATEYTELEAQTLYSKTSTIVDGSLVESAFLRDALALESG